MVVIGHQVDVIHVAVHVGHVVAVVDHEDGGGDGHAEEEPVFFLAVDLGTDLAQELREVDLLAAVGTDVLVGELPVEVDTVQVVSLDVIQDRLDETGSYSGNSVLFFVTGKQIGRDF